MTIFKFITFFVSLLIAVFLVGCGGGSGSGSSSGGANGSGTASLSWTPPTMNTDSSLLVDLAGYKIYYGQTSGTPSDVIVVYHTGISDYLVENLSTGTWYFTVSAIDTSGNESVKSNEAMKEI